MRSIASELSLININAINQLIQVIFSYEGSVSRVEELPKFRAVSQTQHWRLRDRAHILYDRMLSSDNIAASEIHQPLDHHAPKRIQVNKLTDLPPMVECIDTSSGDQSVP